jgi:S-adenosylmethionine decarboxylase
MGTKACVPVGTHPVGTHCILELYGCSPGLLNDLEFVQRSLRDAAKVCESTLIGEVLHQFHPQGVTALALLAESHISIHTWPELGYAAIDIFTCGAATQPEKGCQYLIGVFQSTSHRLQTLLRHPMSNPMSNPRSPG